MKVRSTLAYTSLLVGLDGMVPKSHRGDRRRRIRGPTLIPPGIEHYGCPLGGGGLAAFSAPFSLRQADPLLMNLPACLPEAKDPAPARMIDDD